MPTNLRLTQANFCRVSGYFAHMDQVGDTLYIKSDDGTNAFSYPLNADLTGVPVCLQHDGRSYWTLENNTSANSGNGQLIFRRWEVEDFVLKLIRTYTLNGIAAHKYNSNSFSIEHYHRSFSGAASSGTATITMNSNSRIVAGDVFFLGPSTFPGDEGKTEQITVLSVGGGNQVTFSTNLVNSYNPADPIVTSNRCWFFNRFRPADSDPTNGSGQLFSFDIHPLVTTVTARKAGNEFRTVLASTYLTDNFYTGGARDFLVYANQTNLLFIETDPANINFLNTVQSASQNNQETNSTVIPIHDITHEGNTIFRLQNKATFRNNLTLTTEDWGAQFNYQMATLQRLPTSISLTAVPSVISADSVSTSTITAIVRDQFDAAVPSISVSFTEDDSAGSPQGAILAPTTDTTDSNGIATATYRAGSQPKTVTIQATTV